MVQILSDRFCSQCVRGPGDLSNWAPISVGIPQDTMFGLLLFAMFIDDLRCSFQHCNYILYADNLQIYLHFSSAELGMALVLIRDDISAVARWASIILLHWTLVRRKLFSLGIVSSLIFSFVDYCSMFTDLTGPQRLPGENMYLDSTWIQLARGVALWVTT